MKTDDADPNIPSEEKSKGEDAAKLFNLESKFKNPKLT